MTHQQVAHLAQHFKGTAAPGAGAPIGQRSFLGGLLPESLLHVLISYGPGAFAAALCGDADTPELVWTHRMRAQRLVPQAWHPSTVCFDGSWVPLNGLLSQQLGIWCFCPGAIISIIFSLCACIACSDALKVDLHPEMCQQNHPKSLSDVAGVTHVAISH